MKLFYICPKDETRFIPTGWRALDLGNDKLLVCVNWANDAHEAAWASRPDVIPLPHPIFESATPLTDEHRQHLAGRYKTNSGDTIHHIIKLASREDFGMRLWVL